jgi:hypothetical protein
VDVRRLLEEERLEVARQLLQPAVDAVERCRVRRRDRGELSHRAFVVGPPREDAPVFEDRLEARLARHHPQAVAAEVEVADDLGPEHRGDVGRRRRAASRRDLLGDARAADDLAALEDDRAEPGAREIGGGNEPVVPAADDDRIVLVCAQSLLRRRRGSRARAGSLGANERAAKVGA